MLKGDIGFPFLTVPMGLPKPRNKRITIMSDRGLPLDYQRDLLHLISDIVDYAKLTDHPFTITGSRKLIEKKLSIYEEYNVLSYLGGMIFEIAYSQGKAVELLKRAVQLGFKTVEISESVMPKPLSPTERETFIKQAIDMGLEIFTELGRKFPSDQPENRKAVEMIQKDLNAGVRKVIIESEEVIHLKAGNPTFLTDLLQVVDKDNLVFECDVSEGDITTNARWLIQNFGSDVNLCNVGTQEVVKLDSMRRSLGPEVEYEGIF